MITIIRKAGEGMSDYITAANLEQIVEQNEKIEESINKKLLLLLEQYNLREGIKSEEKLAFKILKQHGLIQIPIENPYWSGAIYYRRDKKIPVINTALPRMNQFFTAWHEVYHLIYGEDEERSIYQISTDLKFTERNADYFAAKALMGNVYSYYVELNGNDFMDKIAQCMDMYQVPYKAILIQLFEDAKAAGNEKLMEEIKDNFDCKDQGWVSRFRRLGLDEELVTPSNVVNVSYLEGKINCTKAEETETSIHEMNERYFKSLKERINNIMKDQNC